MLIVFNQVSLDGYFAGPGGDISWAHEGGDDAEWNAFVEESAGSGGMLVFGRVTYDLMVQYWPTPAAAKENPAVAEHMNATPKVVFSRSLKDTPWKNTTIVSGDAAAEMQKLKERANGDIAILGSGNLVAQLAPSGLIDEYRVVVNPIVLGDGRTMFEGIPAALRLTLASTRAFKNGKVVLTYAASE